MDTRGRRGGAPETTHGGKPCQAKGHRRAGAPEEGYWMVVQERVVRKKRRAEVSYYKKNIFFRIGVQMYEYFSTVFEFEFV
jgi:hypothetical protein